MKKLVDLHAYFLSKEYIAFLKQNDALLEDGFPLPNYDLMEHKQLMEDANISHSFYLFRHHSLILKDMIKSLLQCVDC